MNRDRQHLEMADMDRRIRFLETEKNLSELETKELQILKFARDVETRRVANNKMASKLKRPSLAVAGLDRPKA